MSYVNVKNKEQGSVLLVCLVMLLALTFIGLSSMTNSTMQERIVGGARDQNVAFQAAEAALRAGEDVAVGMVASHLAYSALLPADAQACVINADDWVAPAGLKKSPTAPTCTVTSLYAELKESRQSASQLLNPPEVCIETGELSGPGGTSLCHQESPRGLLFEIEAVGYGSTGATARLRSIYMDVKDID
jgi:type IV pilus assembly protein PilX